MLKTTDGFPQFPQRYGLSFVISLSIIGIILLDLLETHLFVLSVLTILQLDDQWR